MQYLSFAPSAPLQPYVEKFYILEHEGGLNQPVDLLSPANSYAALVFNYGDRYRLHNFWAQGALLPRQFVSGYSTTPYKITVQGQVGMVGVVFKGGGFLHVFPQLVGSDLSDKRLNLADLIGYEAELLTEQLAEAPSHPARIARVEAYLFNRLRKTDFLLHIADHAVHRILNQRGMLTMDGLADDLALSPRHLRRRFSERVGMSPKFFARLKRFNFVSLTLLQNPQLHWPEFLADGGFYDQSHFIKDFVAFTGSAPTEHFALIRRMQESLETEAPTPSVFYKTSPARPRTFGQHSKPSCL